MSSFGEEILVFCGPMWSGKSNELLIQIDKLKYAKIPYLILKPDVDSRTPGYIFTRFWSKSEEAIEISSKNPREILDKVGDFKLPLTIAIDEAQFFDDSLVDVVRELSSRGVNFLISGLDMDANGNPFGPMGALMSIATKVKKLRGICEMCRRESTKTGLKKAIPNFEENNVLVVSEEKGNKEGNGEVDVYMTLCSDCFNKNKRKLASP